MNNIPNVVCDKYIIQKTLNVKITTAEKIIREINRELKKSGYIIEPGRVLASEIVERRKGITLTDIFYHYQTLGYDDPDKYKKSTRID